MAGAVLTQSERELARMSDKNFLALKTATGRLKEAQALAADLRVAVSALQRENGDLTRERDAFIKRLILVCESRGRLVRAYRKAMRQRSASKKRLVQAESVIAAAIIISQEAQQVAIDEHDGTYAIPSASIYRLDAYLEEIGIDQFLVAALETNEAKK